MRTFEERCRSCAVWSKHAVKTSQVRARKDDFSVLSAQVLHELGTKAPKDIFDLLFDSVPLTKQISGFLPFELVCGLPQEAHSSSMRVSDCIRQLKPAHVTRLSSDLSYFAICVSLTRTISNPWLTNAAARSFRVCPQSFLPPRAARCNAPKTKIYVSRLRREH